MTASALSCRANRLQIPQVLLLVASDVARWLDLSSVVPAHQPLIQPIL